MSAAEEGRPDTATVPRFRYLFDRGSPPTAFWPCLGDFVVLTIDPVASVGHLDVAAKRAARKIPRHRFVALVMSGRGIPLETKPFTHHSIALVRRELPTLNHPPWDTPEMCYPILPNTHHPTRSETIQPTHPFPLVDCYIDMTWAFQDPIGCRITTTPCNYTSVLRVMPRQIARLSRLFSQEVTRVEDLEERIRYGDIEVIASIPLPPSPASAARIPLPESPTPSPVSSVKRSQRSRGSKSGALYSPGTHAASDEVSIIGSDDSDSSSSNYDRESEVESDALDGQLFEMMRFEDMVNDTGDPRDPVADVSYDLDDVDEVTDPLLFIKVRDQLRR
ncbi:unnamed protein product [Peniophora sp. CBMAI 1063]|nr:unnamed protein product [Peniophora sp. CBMAI 1063]